MDCCPRVNGGLMQKRNLPEHPTWTIIDDKWLCVRDQNSPDDDWIPIAKIFDGFIRSAYSLLHHANLGERVEELMDDFIGSETRAQMENDMTYYKSEQD